MAEKEIKTMKGIVAATAQNADNRFGVKIGADWFDAFGRCPVGKGDLIAIEYYDSNGHNNIKRIMGDVVDWADGGTQEPLGKDESIARAVALKCAVQMPTATTPAKAIGMAEKFKKWLLETGAVTGDGNV